MPFARTQDIRDQGGEDTHLNPRDQRRGREKAPRQGEIWLADSLLFDDGIHSKGRPVLVKSRRGNDFLCYRCTSKESSFRERYRVSDIDEAGLAVCSFIDYESVLVPREKLIYRLGTLSEDDRQGFGRL